MKAVPSLDNNTIGMPDDLDRLTSDILHACAFPNVEKNHDPTDKNKDSIRINSKACVIRNVRLVNK